jgi:hypothetical protein
MLRQRWQSQQAAEKAVLASQVPAKPLISPPGVAPAEPATPAAYLNVAEKMLFAKDRNPNVVVEAPAPKPEPPLPTLPKYHGQMGFGEPVILLSLGGDQHGYRAGEQVGEFKIASFDREKIALEWNNKTIERKLDELVAPAEPGPVASSGAPSPPSPIANVARSEPERKADSGPGEQETDTLRACVSGDRSPAGTIVNGWKKVSMNTMFGQACHWELVK